MKIDTYNDERSEKHTFPFPDVCNFQQRAVDYFPGGGGGVCDGV